jgi:hypothetical protein
MSYDDMRKSPTKDEDNNTDGKYYCFNFIDVKSDFSFTVISVYSDGDF